MTCKLDHDDPLCIPAWLCRTCTPTLSLTPAETRAAIAAERKTVTKRIERESLARQARVLELKIEKLTPHAREPRPDSVSGKLLVSYRAQLKKLTRKVGR